jgi:hypothetical protein
MEVAKPWKKQLPKPVVVPPEFGARLGPSSWSPDGRKLAGGLTGIGSGYLGLGIDSRESGKPERLTYKLYLMDNQSRKQREILSVAA